MAGIGEHAILQQRSIYLSRKFFIVQVPFSQHSIFFVTYELAQ